MSFLLQDEVLFDSWDAIFNGGKMKDAAIYSFDGRDILTDEAWSVINSQCNPSVTTVLFLIIFYLKYILYIQLSVPHHTNSGV